jgi:hypothetical protein
MIKNQILFTFPFFTFLIIILSKWFDFLILWYKINNVLNYNQILLKIPHSNLINKICY